MRRGSGREDARRGSRIAGSRGTPAAVLAAGGTGRRVGGDLPKQFIDIAGRPLIRWSYDLLAGAGCDPVVVVVPSQHIEQTERLLDDPRARVVAGGDTRQASVRAGLSLIGSETVVVHDAARPFATRATLAAVIDALDDSDGAVPGIPVKDTIKVVSGGRVVQTPDRSTLWAIQTPQAFVTEVLKRAHERAVMDGVEATDDAQLVEHYGGRVAVVAGTAENLKVTEPGDLERAAAVAGGAES